jgi:uncharacterized protein (DUF2147 family)
VNTNTGIVCLSVFGALAASQARAAALEVDGVWLTADRDGHVEIRDCGDATPCGRLVWYDPAKRGGPLDARNPIARLRTRALIGTPIFWGFARKYGEWTGGNIYNPQDGKTFTSKLRMGVDGALVVTGCLGPICITRRWTRVGA